MQSNHNIHLVQINACRRKDARYSVYTWEKNQDSFWVQKNLKTAKNCQNKLKITCACMHNRLKGWAK